MEPALCPPRRPRKPSENRDKLGTSINPDHARRVFRESLEVLLDGLERG